MSDIHEVGRIQINEDLDFLRREWRIQRIGWIAMLLTILLGLAGALGRGPLAATQTGDPATLAIAYDRIIRHGAATEVRITAGPSLPADTMLRVLVSARYLNTAVVADIIPEPTASGVSGDFIYYDFPRLDTAAPSRIVLRLNANGYWRAGGRILVRGAAPVEVHQVILP